MKKLIVLLLMTVATGGSAWAQYINNGKVLGKEGSPISGATVRGKGLMSSTTTNMDGSFSFETTLPIKQIEVSYMGKTKTQKRTEYTTIVFGTQDGSGRSTSRSEYPWFLVASGGYQFGGEYNSPMVGIMLGYSESWGGYLAGMYGQNDNTLLTAGIIKRVSKTFNVYLGGGVAQYSYEDWWEPEVAPVVDLGLLFKFNRLMLNFGMAADFSEVASFRVGFGYAF